MSLPSGRQSSQGRVFTVVVQQDVGDHSFKATVWTDVRSDPLDQFRVNNEIKFPSSVAT